jgi:4-amino-4-deoxy-L-arabinose transferase-like glycosyltransferase
VVIPKPRWQLLAVIALVFALRLPFLNQAIQGDDPYYLYGAEHAQFDPLHPTHAKYLFQGDMVDMRGHPHGPFNSWELAAPLYVLGDVREVPFHFRYILWSMISAIAMLSIARRFSDQPLLATLLFLAVPAFVVNGNSLEADLPFLAMWMGAIALFVKGIDENSRWALWLAAFFGALAGLAAYQSVLITPVLGFYLLQKQRRSWVAWSVVLAAPVTIAVWQLYELATSGALPAAVLLGYMQHYSLQSGGNKLRSAAALTIHLAWIVSPLITLFMLLRMRKIRWDFIAAWIVIFFTGAALVFFAGSARYLLPIAAPMAILAVRLCPRPVLYIGLATQMALSIALAMVNYQHWDAYRVYAKSLAKEAAEHRVWINAEWGLRWYLEQEGAVAMPKDQIVQPGDIVVSSALALPLPVNAQFAQLSQIEIKPSIPLRLISLAHTSAYSSVSEHGLWPFEVSNGPIDRVKAEVAVERNPQLIWISANDPQATAQIIGGLSPDGWTSDKVTLLLKRPDHLMPFRVELFIPPMAPARHVQVFIDGQMAAEDTFRKPGSYVISMPPDASAKGPVLTVTLTVDQTFSTANDHRKLGLILGGIGFR